MKKLLALILAAMLLCLSCAAFAESTDKEIVKYDDGLSFAFVYPEGYTADTATENGVMLSIITSEDESAAAYVLIVAPDSYVEDVMTINEMSDEDKTAFAESLIEDLANPTWEIRTTGLGTEMIVIDEQDTEQDIVILTALYDGYILNMYITHTDGATVTEEEIATGIQINTDMDFLETAE